MGTKKKMKLPFLLTQSKSLDSKLSLSSSSSSSSSIPSPWPFPSCGNIRTLSFRAKDDDDEDDAFRTFNSAFLESEFTPPDSYFTNISFSSRSFSTMSEDSGDPVEESVIRGLSSDRLFFDPERSSSLLLRDKEQEQEKQKQKVEVEEEEEEVVVVAYKESEMLSMESISPYEDFKKSMEEMVEAHSLKDWQGLEELLGCYLKINGQSNHGYIIGAFIDLLVSLSFDSSSTTNNTTTTTSSSSTSTTTLTTSSTTTSSSYSNYSSPSSPLSLPSSSSLTTPCLSSILDHDDNDDDDDDEDDDANHDDHVSC